MGEDSNAKRFELSNRLVGAAVETKDERSGAVFARVFHKDRRGGDLGRLAPAYVAGQALDVDRVLRGALIRGRAVVDLKVAPAYVGPREHRAVRAPHEHARRARKARLFRPIGNRGRGRSRRPGKEREILGSIHHKVRPHAKPRGAQDLGLGGHDRSLA